MPFLFIRNNTPQITVDAVVNPENMNLQEASQANYVIHATAPLWKNGKNGEDQALYKAYIDSMQLAREHGLNSIAFPLLSSGNYGYPQERAMASAVSAIRDFLSDNELMVYLVLPHPRAAVSSWELSNSIEKFIHKIGRNQKEGLNRKTVTDTNTDTVFSLSDTTPSESYLVEDSVKEPAKQPAKKPAKASALPQCPRSLPPPPVSSAPPAPSSRPAPPMGTSRARMLDEIMLHMGETFSQMLLRLIDERGLTDPQVYHKANIDRKLFSKIRTNIHYSPTKKTVMAFAVALELSLDETKDLLRTAGYSFSDSSRFDIIIRFFLERQIYDIFEINEMLFYYEQPLLGN